MTVSYTARAVFDRNSDASTSSWNKFIEWSRLTQLTELVSLDSMLNEVLVEIDRNNSKDWDNIITDNYYETGLFRSLDYVLHNVKTKNKFNLLAAIIEPSQDCKNVNLDGFDFLGYDLLDKDYIASALTNCGGFDETFLPSELNNFGLLSAFDRSYEVKKELYKNNPEEHHADTNVIAVWRHNKIGR